MKNFKNLLKDNFGHYVVLEIDGVKKLMRNGQSGQYVVSNKNTKKEELLRDYYSTDPH